jgi:hypothetical protein
MKIMPRYQTVASKLRKTAVILRNEQLKPYIPESQKYSRQAVLSMLRRHPFVFLKPDIGGGGKGAIKLTLSGDQVKCQTLNGRRVLRINEVFPWIERQMISGRTYMAQQGIEMAQADGRNVDFRVHLQKPRDHWLITGFCAKLAPPGSLVTNRCRGGQALEASQALKKISHHDHKKEKSLNEEIYFVSKEIAKTLNERFTGLKELGVDLTVDQNENIWIFEVNTRPVIKLFQRLKDKTAYQQINRIRKQML